MIHVYGLMLGLGSPIIHTLLPVILLHMYYVHIIFAHKYFSYVIILLLLAGKYYLVDSGYPNRTGYLAPFKEQRYHVPEFQSAPPRNMMERFNHLHSCL
jgi:hypothetical protein